MATRVDQLKAIPLFSGLAQADLQFVADRMEEVSIPAGTVMITEGAGNHEGPIAKWRRQDGVQSKRSRVTTARPVLSSWYPATITWRPVSSPTAERWGTSIKSRPKIVSSRVVRFQ